MRFVFFTRSPLLKLRSPVTRSATTSGLSGFAVGLIFSVLSGCATEDIIVSEVAITDRADASVVGWAANESGRQVFSAEDEEVTIKILFNFNYRF